MFDLIGLAARDRRLVQNTGRDLQVLRPQRREHFAGAEIVDRGLVRIDPDAHRVLAAALEFHVADARQARQHVLDMQRRIVRQIKRIARLVGGVEVNAQQDARDRLANLHAETLHIVRKA